MLVGPAFAEIDTFEQILALTYQNNPALQAERAKLRAVDERVPQALSGWRPNVQANADIGKTNGNTQQVGNNNTNTSNTSINVTQPIFKGFRTTAAVESAEAVVKAQRANLLDAEQTILLNTAKAYLDVVQAQSTLAINTDNENVLQQQFNATLERFDIGELKMTDVSQAQSRLIAAKVSRLQAEGDLSNQKIIFAKLVGKLPGTLQQPDLKLSLPQTQQEAMRLSLEKNPKIISANYNAEAAHSNIKASKGNLLPEVNLIASASHSNQDGNFYQQDNENTTALLARVTMPLYKTGEDYSRIREAQQTEKQRRLENIDVTNKAKEDVFTSWQSLMTARLAMTGRQEVIQASQEALEGVKQESVMGTRTILDVLNAEQELLNAKVNLVRAIHDEALSSLQLKASIGELTAETLRLPTQIYNPEENYDTVRNKWYGFADHNE